MTEFSTYERIQTQLRSQNFAYVGEMNYIMLPGQTLSQSVEHCFAAQSVTTESVCNSDHHSDFVKGQIK